MSVREIHDSQNAVLKQKSFQIHQENKFSSIWLKIVKNDLIFYSKHVYFFLFGTKKCLFFFTKKNYHVKYKMVNIFLR